MTMETPIDPFNFPSPLSHHHTEDELRPPDYPSETKPFHEPGNVSTPNYAFSTPGLYDSPGSEWLNPSNHQQGGSPNGDTFQNVPMAAGQLYHPELEQSNYHFQPHELTYTSSNSSLASFNSASGHQPTHNPNSLIVQTYPIDFDPTPNDITSSTIQAHNLSRQSSYSSVTSYDNKALTTYQHGYGLEPNGGMGYPSSNSYFGNITHALPGSLIPDDVYGMELQPSRQPKLAVQTQGLGRIAGRRRSMSRTMPYSRHHKSESLSAASEDDDGDLGALLSSTSTTQSSFQTPWSAVTNNSIARGLNNMTLHHRRTSSTSMSPAKGNPLSRPMLARSRRSSSILSKQPSQPEFSTQLSTTITGDDLELTGSAAERDEAVKNDLMEKAKQILTMSSASQQDKARTGWVRRWLQVSYAEETGCTVPRQGLYHSYTLSCEDYGLKPINSASFGKAVRNAFVGIKTRRLGVRGNSKYHYVAIRPSIRIEAERLNAFGDSSGGFWRVAPEDGTMGFSRNVNHDVEMDGEDVDDEDDDEDDECLGNSPIKKSPSSREIRHSSVRDRSTSIDNPTTTTKLRINRRNTTSMIDRQLSPYSSKSQVYSPVYTLAGFPSISLATTRRADVEIGIFKAFWDEFCKHLDIIAGCVRDFHFDRYEMHLRTFWTSLTPEMNMCCQDPVISQMISEALTVSVDNMIATLLSKLLNPISVSVKECIDRFAKNLENITEEAFIAFDKEFKETKIELIVRAAHLLLRFNDLHQLTIALLPILSNQEQVRMMITAWTAIDQKSLLDSAALTCNCRQEVLEAVMSEFYGWMCEVEMAPGKGGRALETLGRLMDEILARLQAGSYGFVGIPTKTLVPRTGWFTSQIMRDFTLKSSPSFGLFQLLKTWIDDWIIISAIRQTGLSLSSVDPDSFVPPAETTIYPNPINITIPSQVDDPYSADMPTAVPYATNGYNGNKGNSNGSSAMPTYGSSAQYLTLPNYGDGNLVTPRPSFNLTYAEEDKSGNGNGDHVYGQDQGDGSPHDDEASGQGVSQTESNVDPSF